MAGNSIYFSIIDLVFFCCFCYCCILVSKCLRTFSVALIFQLKQNHAIKPHSHINLKPKMNKNWNTNLKSDQNKSENLPKLFRMFIFVFMTFFLHIFRFTCAITNANINGNQFENWLDRNSLWKFWVERTFNANKITAFSLRLMVILFWNNAISLQPQKEAQIDFIGSNNQKSN